MAFGVSITITNETPPHKKDIPAHIARQYIDFNGKSAHNIGIAITGIPTKVEIRHIGRCANKVYIPQQCFNSIFMTIITEKKYRNSAVVQ